MSFYGAPDKAKEYETALRRIDIALSDDGEPSVNAPHQFVGTGPVCQFCRKAREDSRHTEGR